MVCMKNGLARAAGWPFQGIILSFRRIAKMVECKKSRPKAFTKGNCLGLQKSAFFIIFTVKRNVLGHFGMFISSFGSWAGQDFLQRPSLRYWKIGILGSEELPEAILSKPSYL